MTIRHENELTTDELLAQWDEAEPAELVDVFPRWFGSAQVDEADSYSAFDKVPMAAMNSVVSLGVEVTVD